MGGFESAAGRGEVAGDELVDRTICICKCDVDFLFWGLAPTIGVAVPART